MKIEWNLRMLCARKGIWTAAELERLLVGKVGVRLSHQTVCTLMRSTPKNLSLQILLALCVVLECSPNDVLVVDRSPSVRGAKALADEIERVGRARSRGVKGGPRPRRKPAPPSTRI
jgi:DNA-binding Xre family transcriptional regulator